jgi:hypothetical protein
MTGKEKVSLSLDRSLVAEVRRRVGKRELSSYLNEALERRLQADAITQYLIEMEERSGPVPRHVATAVDDAYARRFKHARPRSAKRA